MEAGLVPFEYLHDPDPRDKQHILQELAHKRDVAEQLELLQVLDKYKVPMAGLNAYMRTIRRHLQDLDATIEQTRREMESAQAKRREYEELLAYLRDIKYIHEQTAKTSQ